jgi:hypothetical protein
MEDKTMTRKIINISTAILIISVVTIIVAAQHHGPNPSGLNQSNLVTLQGVVESANMGLGQRFPSFTLVQASGIKVTIMVGPYYLLQEQHFTITVGDRMTVQAFPSYRFADTYASVELNNLTTGVTIALRDQDGFPLWAPGAGGPGWGPGRAGMGGYCGGPNMNPANIVSLEGTVKSVDMALGERFPSFVLARADGSEVTIMAGPYRLLLENNFVINVGDYMTVRAYPSLWYKDTYVAIELKNPATGATITLRDEYGVPIGTPGGGRGRRGGGRCWGNT